MTRTECGTHAGPRPSDTNSTYLRRLEGTDGRVRGVDGLRVADASILLSVTRANTNLTAILVGEKIAQAMREDAALVH